MLQRTIDNLKERPKEERVAFAGSVAIGAIVILFLGWVLFFVTSFHKAPIAESTLPDAQSASAVSAVPDFQDATQAPIPDPTSDAAFGDQSAAQSGAQVQITSTTSEATTSDQLTQ